MRVIYELRACFSLHTRNIFEKVLMITITFSKYFTIIRETRGDRQLTVINLTNNRIQCFERKMIALILLNAYAHMHTYILDLKVIIVSVVLLFAYIVFR